MAALAEEIVQREATYACNREAIEVVRELEHRRELACKDPSRLLDGDDQLQALLASRSHV